MISFGAALNINESGYYWYDDGARGNLRSVGDNAVFKHVMATTDPDIFVTLERQKSWNGRDTDVATVELRKPVEELPTSQICNTSEVL
jgi:hypothetical protein